MNHIRSIIQPSLKDKFVLVIEPTISYRSSIKGFLTNLRIKNIRVVGSVAEAKRELLSIKVGLIICEWRLKEKNGIVFCRELKSDLKYRDIPFLLTSTENLKKDIILASEGGVSSYLLKPFSFEDFCKHLESLMSELVNPSNLNTLLDQAEKALISKEFWEAESLFLQALDVKRTSARAKAGLGRVELENGRLDKADALFREALALNEEYIDAYKGLLSLAEIRDDHVSTLEIATKLQELSPENPRYPLILAKCQLENGDLASSEAMFKAAVRLSPTLVDAFRGLGQLYLQKQEYESSSKMFEKALDLDRGDVPTLNSLALTYVKRGMIEEGVKKYRLALSIDAFDSRIHFNLGLACMQIADYAQAKEAFEKALESSPGMEKARRQLEILNDKIKTLHSSNTTPKSA
jgi:tetratricopeptide (TPR) repeat protein